MSSVCLAIFDISLIASSLELLRQSDCVFLVDMGFVGSWISDCLTPSGRVWSVTSSDLSEKESLSERLVWWTL